MRFLKLKIALVSLVTLFAFNGCSQYEQALVANAVSGNTAYQNPYYYNGYNYGYSRDAYYRYGVTDGCRSSQRGRTIRNSYRWRNYSSYRSGWYAGKSQCRGSYYDSGNYYNRGYSDGCSSRRYRGYRKSNRLYNNYRSYRNGWNRGYRNCRRRY